MEAPHTIEEESPQPPPPTEAVPPSTEEPPTIFTVFVTVNNSQGIPMPSLRAWVESGLQVASGPQGPDE